MTRILKKTFILICIFNSFIICSEQTKQNSASNLLSPVTTITGLQQIIASYLCDEWNLTTTLKHEAHIIVYSPNGKYIASGDYTKTIKIFDVKNQSYIHTLTGHREKIRSLIFSPNSDYLASGSGPDYGPETDKSERVVKIWDVTRGRCIKTLTGHSGGIKSLTYSPDGNYIASGTYCPRALNEIKIWDISTSKCIQDFTTNEVDINALIYSEDGKYLISGSHSGLVKIWNIKTKENNTIFSNGSLAINSLALSPNGHFLAVGARNTIPIYDISNIQEVKLIHTISDIHTQTVLAYSPDGNYIAFGTSTSGDIFNGSIKIFDVRNNQITTLPDISKNTVSQLRYSPCGTYIASVSCDSIIKIWQNRALKLLESNNSQIGLSSIDTKHGSDNKSQETKKERCVLQ